MESTALMDRAIDTTCVDRHVEALSRMYQQLGSRYDRPTFARAVEDALYGFDGHLESDWHLWLDEALQSLGFRCHAIVATPEQVVEIVAGGSFCTTRLGEGDGAWLAIGGETRGRIQVLRSELEATWQTNGETLGMLKDWFPDDSSTWVVVERGLAVSESNASPGVQPLSRLWALLKPEWPDIWIVMVFALVIGLLALATPIAVETLVNTVAFGKFLQPVVVLSLMLLVFLAFSGALRAVQTHVVEIIQRRLFVRVAADIAYRLPRARTEALDGHSGRELVNRFFDVVTVQKVAAQLLLDGLSLLLGTLIGMAMLAFYHPWLLGFDVMLLVMLAVIVLLLGRGAVKSSVKESKTKYHMAAWLEDLAGCPTAFRYDGAARFALDRADYFISNYLTARAQHFRILMRQIVFSLGMQALASTVLLCLGGWLVIMGQLTLGQLVAAELIVAVIVGSFAKLGKHMESLYDVLASVDKLGALFDLPLEKQDGLSGIADGDVVLTQVTCHDAQGRQVLQDFDLTIGEGDRIAVTGDEGRAGFLLDLLFGLRTPKSGRVNILGVDIREMRPQALRRHVALVRGVEVFQGSIIDNIRIGRNHLSTQDVRQVLSDVGLLDDLLGLPEQLDTVLLSTGHPLSSAQLGKLMLARACVSDPSVLLIDRALDALPDSDAASLLSWLCREDHPWKLLLTTGREQIVAQCNQRIDFPAPASSLPAGVEGKEDPSHG